jgi:DNA end-binding protein Ku
LISELSGTEFQPENYEDEYRKRLLKAIEQKVAGQEIERLEVKVRPPTTDLIATLKAQPWTEGVGEGVTREVKGGAEASEAAGTPASRVVAAADLSDVSARRDDGLFSFLLSLRCWCVSPLLPLASGSTGQWRRVG